MGTVEVFADSPCMYKRVGCTLKEAGKASGRGGWGLLVPLTSFCVTRNAGICPPNCVFLSRVTPLAEISVHLTKPYAWIYVKKKERRKLEKRKKKNTMERKRWEKRKAGEGGERGRKEHRKEEGEGVAESQRR